MHKCIELECRDEWIAALEGVRHSFAHTWENNYAMSLTTGYRTYLYSFENKGVKIICPIAERKYKGYIDIVTPYGFSGFTGNQPSIEFQKHWSEFVAEKNYICGYISMNPYLQDESYFRIGDAFRNTDLYFIDLKQSLTELFEKLDANRKKQIRDFRKAESNFIYDKDVLTDFFLNNYKSFLKRINASPANYFERETLESICRSENVFMVGSGGGIDIEAVYIFGYTPYAGDCLFNVAIPEGREFAPLLLWCGLKFLKKKKIPVVNLGGGLKEDDSVALSKQRFGAYKLPFVNLKQIYDESIYKKLCNENNLDVNDRSGYFPVYRKPKP
ncbi:MAG: hypothetical protein ABI528_00040 [bacterium]